MVKVGHADVNSLRLPESRSERGGPKARDRGVTMSVIRQDLTDKAITHPRGDLQKHVMPATCVESRRLLAQAGFPTAHLWIGDAMQPSISYPHLGIAGND